MSNDSGSIDPLYDRFERAIQLEVERQAAILEGQIKASMRLVLGDLVTLANDRAIVYEGIGPVLKLDHLEKIVTEITKRYRL